MNCNILIQAAIVFHILFAFCPSKSPKIDVPSSENDIGRDHSESRQARKFCTCLCSDFEYTASSDLTTFHSIVLSSVAIHIHSTYFLVLIFVVDGKIFSFEINATTRLSYYRGISFLSSCCFQIV